MLPNLDRISGDGDAVAWAILERAPDPIDQGFLESLAPEAWLWLGRFGTRQVTIALREGSADLLHRGLLATGLSVCLRSEDDRDTMVSLALPCVVAQHLDMAPVEVFAEIADRVPDARVAELLRRFGARSDVTLRAFGWEMVMTPGGLDFQPLP
ncbi:hypothetical protein [Actinomadura alba]|uniref:Uncharacterized protein n=1 Tax=Actinomadura alba TaxID=406431 RepID=A0ABR7LT59_9ACTN|nr:hypothetical protein [Actinomadura alba]MBC6468037.1 hypothetical protein [Actinomadura alba]